MKIVLLSGAIVGAKTRITLNHAYNMLAEHYPKAEVTVVDLAEYDVQFSDGRNYWDYDYGGDTRYVAQTVLSAQALIIGAPVYQASIPAPLKNVFDLLPVHALRDAVAGIIMTAGSARHYLVAEQQLKPILSYLRAQIVPNYVFIEERDFNENDIANPEILLRIHRLVEDTVALADLYKRMRETPP
ncbi:MAG: NAD(P)H-dependent oxidoreductase, partial [Firmicutes bacterium]|nr:NAD(P)H-dependent oxidoreductase [Bacillota bacterium]